MNKLSAAIIGRNEEETIARCLDSINDVVDEICFVDTGSTDRTLEIVSKYPKCKIFHFEWVDDFSKARNFSFSCCSGPLIFWCDCDDILEEDDRKEILALKERDDYDMVLFEYWYATDAFGNPLCKLPRHRIIRKNSDITWRGRIHECMNFPAGMRILDFAERVHVHHQRTAKQFERSRGRNIKIFREWIKEEPDNPRVQYYFAKDLAEAGENKEAIGLFEKFIAENRGWDGDIICAHRHLAACYYGEKRIDDAIKILTEAIRKYPSYAEYYCKLGQIYYEKALVSKTAEDWAKSRIWYLHATSLEVPKSLATLELACYTFEPHDRLAFVYSQFGELEKANYHNEIALKYCPDDKRMLFNRKWLSERLNPKMINAIGWVAPENWEAAQTRIRVLNINKWLKSKGYNSKILNYDEAVRERYSTVIVGKGFDENHFKNIEWLKSVGIYVICDLCEDIVGWPWVNEILGLCDKVVCCSHALARKVRDININVEVIGDSVEADYALNCIYEDKEKLKAVFCGYGGGAELARRYKAVFEETGYELVEIHEWDDATIKWDRATWQQEMVKCDVAVAFQRAEQPCKSNVKLTQAQALGLPVIASQMEAYVRISENYKGVLFANDSADVRMALQSLRDHKKRKEIGQRGKADSLPYHIDNIGQKWADLLFNERIDIIIPTYNNLKYLKLCLESIEKCTKDIRYNIIVVNNSTDNSIKEYLDLLDVKAIHTGKRMTFSDAINLGLSISRGKAVCLLNDDTIVSYGWLSAMNSSLGMAGIVGCLSNCDKGWLHNLEMKVDGINLVPGMSYESMAAHFHELCCVSLKHGANTREWVAFYCTLISRETLNKVGTLNTEFKSGGEDADFCYRARKLGINIVQNWDAFVFHFGGKTRKTTEIENPDRYKQEDEFNNKLLTDKWAKKSLVFYTGPAWEKWSPDSIDNGGIGGSETACAFMANCLSKLGWRVTVFNDCSERKTYDGVEYIPYGEFRKYVDENYMDVFISSRRLEVFALNIRSGANYFWCHDIWADANGKVDMHMEKIKAYFCLSPWHAKFFSGHHGIPMEKIIVTSNGIDLKRFEKDIKKENRLIYSSSPDRGLDTLLYLFPFIKERIPDLTLHVYYGFDNWNKAIEVRGDQNEKNWRNQILSKLYQPGVFVYGRVGQAELADGILRSKLWFFPTRFTETFCISALEMMAGGVPIVATNLAALTTTVGEHGVLVDGDAYTQECRQKLVAEVVAMFTDEVKWQKYSDGGKEYVKKFEWMNVAKQWNEIL